MKKLSYFSAADLVKKSAAQILFIAAKRIHVAATYRQKAGDYHAAEVTLKEEASAEKRGVVNYNDITVFFCIDMVKDNKFVEIKMVDNMDDYPEWYLQSSILQATLYASLLQDVKTLDTPTFRRKEGFLQELVRVDNPSYELWFGDDKYAIYPNDKVKAHYLHKAEVVYGCIGAKLDYDTCRAFDAKYKHKEFKLLKPKFTKIL